MPTIASSPRVVFDGNTHLGWLGSGKPYTPATWHIRKLLCRSRSCAAESVSLADGGTRFELWCC
jgi:hypothetical protein